MVIIFDGTKKIVSAFLVCFRTTIKDMQYETSKYYFYSYFNTNNLLLTDIFEKSYY